MTRQSPFPVIDLFAGPGGLGEGFSSIVDGRGDRRFEVKISVEKDEIAHKTLSLRALFRSFRNGAIPDSYYDYVRGNITRAELFAHRSIPEDARVAASEAKCAELGVTPHKTIDAWIRSALDGAKEWVLIGGPPCQAYSVAGRARLRPTDPVKFENDKRHFLYTEYLRIIREFGPAVFVMENVKGMLTSRHGGLLIFDRILADLRSPGNGFEYRIRSLVVDGEELQPQDYVIEAEKFGVPQTRHRVILFGIRSDLAASAANLLRQPGLVITTFTTPRSAEALPCAKRLACRFTRQTFCRWHRDNRPTRTTPDMSQGQAGSGGPVCPEVQTAAVPVETRRPGTH